MQKEGKVRFLKYHEDKPVKSVSFNPKERYIFCSCASDGKVGTRCRPEETASGFKFGTSCTGTLKRP